MKLFFYAILMNLLVISGCAHRSQPAGTDESRAPTPAGTLADTWPLDGVTSFELVGVSGDIEILKSTGGAARIELQADVDPKEGFNTEVKNVDGALRIEEEWGPGSTRGSVSWRIFLPQQGPQPSVEIKTASGNLVCHGEMPRIEFKTASGDVTLNAVTLTDRSKFKTASGDFHVESSKGEMHLQTASGDILLKNVVFSGESKCSTASGDIKSVNCTGPSELVSASGSISMHQAELQGESVLKVASGDVIVELDRLTEQPFAATSASGDVSFQVADFGNDFTLEMTKREDHGAFKCPFPFTEESTFEQHGVVYQKKLVKRGTGKPLISLSTASGSVVVKP